MDERTLSFLRSISLREFERFLDFLNSHQKHLAVFNGKSVSYYACGAGNKVLLTFAGGWGGIELAYETVLGFEGRNRFVVVDISPFDDPDEMSDGVNHVLDVEHVNKVIVVGQSLSGIIGQSYFVKNFERVDGIVLTNTPALRKERNKEWALWVLRILPLGLFKHLVRRKMSRLGEYKVSLAPEILERRRFAAALLGCMIDNFWTKKNILNILKLIFAFNKQNEYSASSLSGWEGKSFIITSPDDPYYPDVGFFMENLPNSHKFEFPPGFGHTAPQIHRDVFHSVIQEFIDSIEGKG